MWLRKHWWKQHKSWLCIVTVWTQMHNLYMEITIVVPMHFYIICWPPCPSSGAAQLLWWRSLESSSLIKRIREIGKREFQMKSSNLFHFHNSNAGGFNLQSVTTWGRTHQDLQSLEPSTCRARLPGGCPEGVAVADPGQDPDRAVRGHARHIQVQYSA